MQFRFAIMVILFEMKIIRSQGETVLVDYVVQILPLKSLSRPNRGLIGSLASRPAVMDQQSDKPQRLTC